MLTDADFLVRDEVNNVESVRIPAAPPGTYLVQVIGRDVPGGGSGQASHVCGRMLTDTDGC
jgi:hypothetical protein